MARISSKYIADSFRHIFTVIVMLALIFYHDWRLAAIYLLVLPAIITPIRKIGKRLKRLSRERQEKLAELNVILQEGFLGNKIVKAFQMEGYEGERFGRENLKLFKLRMKSIGYAPVAIDGVCRSYRHIFGYLVWWIEGH